MKSSTDPFPSLEHLGVPDGARPGIAGGVARSGHRQQLEDGYAEGLRQGLAEGMRQAADAARSDISFALTALHAAIEDLHRRDAVGVDEVTAEVIDLAMAIAEIIVGREIDAAIDPGRDALVRALALAPDRGAVVARFHPADLQRLGDVTAPTAGRDVQFVPDPSVGPGGCLMDVGAARIDAQIPAALDRVRAALFDARLVDDPVVDDGADGFGFGGTP